MAAYAALVSVMQIVHQIGDHHSPPVSLDTQQVQSLTQKVNLLQEFLEGYNSPYAYSDEADPLEMRISYAAYAAEDALESYVLHNIKISAETTDPQLKEVNAITFYEQLQKVMQDMDSILGEVSSTVGVKAAVEAQLQSNVVSRDADFGSRKSVMVGFEEQLLQLLHSLTGGESSRQVIPIVGMGGIGKTTLALNVFKNQLINEHFDIRVWATISQSCDIRETMAQILSQVRGNSVDKSETELGEKIYKILCGQKYLIVLDDMWSLEVWDKVKFFFPDYNNGSRVIVTTRLSNMATKLTDHPNSLLNVKSLDEVSSWDLFSQTVFGVDAFPLQLQEIGRKIVKKCNGHPLAIVVIGGLLAKAQKAQKHWEDIEANIILRVNSENDEYCLRILRMSYNHLPVRVKPCFLYMGVFEEDRSIRVSTLVELWVCEGFVRPTSNKSLETIAEEYLNELVDRNLIMVETLGSLGNIKYVKIHDLLRDLSLREARKQRLYHDVRDEVGSGDMISHRRITLGKNAGDNDDILRVVELNLHVRSILGVCRPRNPFPDFRRMLRILTPIDDRSNGYMYNPEEVFLHWNLRYLDFCIMERFLNKIPSSINLLWNLHTILFRDSLWFRVPVEIWKMRQLRHIESMDSPTMHLPAPPPPPSTNSSDHEIVIMENLHTLKGSMNLYLDEELVQRIRNIKKLSVFYGGGEIDRGRAKCVSYFGCLNKLESLICWTSAGESEEVMDNIAFPKSLKKLKLIFTERDSWNPDPTTVKWEGILQKISSLRHLQKLALSGGVFETCKWETMEDQFPSLKVLVLHMCGQLYEWVVPDSSHFPCLQELRLEEISHMEEIPSEIGNISTLKSIVLWRCSMSVVESAKKIVDEQEELQGEQPDLHVRLQCGEEKKDEVQHLASPNFHIDFSY